MSSRIVNPYQTFYDSTGKARSGGLITFFVDTTTTLGTIYSDDALTVSQANPYTLDAAGRIIGDVKYDGLMTLQVTNSDGSDIETIQGVITTNTTETLRTDLASTLSTKGKALVQGSFIDSVNTILSASTYSVVAADRGTLIEQTSVQSTTVTLLAAATATEGFTVAFRNNSSTGIWTIVGNGGEAINEGTNVILAVGEWCVLVSDGVSSWRALVSNEPYLKAVTAISVNTTVDSGDKGLLFDASGTITVTTPPAATVKEGFSFTVRNSSTGTITIDGNLAETINAVASITLTANQWAVLVSDGTNWSAVGGTISFTAAATSSSGKVVQVVNIQDGGTATGNTAIPLDDTIPQSAEGDEFLSLAITPLDVTNLLKIEVVGHFTAGNTKVNLQMALFKAIPPAATIASAIAATTGLHVDSSSSSMPMRITHWITAGTLSQIVFSVRAGETSGILIHFNSNPSSSRLFGGVFDSGMTITEYTA